MRASFRIGEGHPSHNDNTFSGERGSKQQHPELESRNVYFAFEDGRPVRVSGLNGLLYEREADWVRSTWGAALEARNAMYYNKGKAGSCKTFEEYREANVREIILQIGDASNRGEEVHDDDLQEVALEYARKLSARSDNARVDVLSLAIHKDETSVHAHLRFAASIKDKNGRWKADRTGAFRELGYEDVPFEEATDEEKLACFGRTADKHKPSDCTRTTWNRLHNPTVAFTDAQREVWYDVVEAAGFSIERETDPKNRSTRNEATQAWNARELGEKVEEARGDLKSTQEEAEKARKRRETEEAAAAAAREEKARISRQKVPLEMEVKKLRKQAERLAKMAAEDVPMSNSTGRLSDAQRKLCGFAFTEYLEGVASGEILTGREDRCDGLYVPAYKEKDAVDAAALLEAMKNDPAIAAYAAAKFEAHADTVCFTEFAAGNRRRMEAAVKKVAAEVRKTFAPVIAGLQELGRTIVEAMRESSDEYER